MKHFKTTLGKLRNGNPFSTWQDTFDLSDDTPVTVFEDGSVNHIETGELLAPPEPIPDYLARTLPWEE